MIDAVREQNVVQIITDNEPQHKTVKELLIRQRLHIYWISFAVHCIYLILMDIEKLRKMQQIVNSA